MNTNIEASLKNMRWREPSSDVMRRSLEAALVVRRDVVGSRSRRRAVLLAALAACWLLSLFFRLATPEAVPASTMATTARLAPGESAKLIASMRERQRLAELLLAHLERRGRSAASSSPTSSILP
jgi:hypothetical protein